MKVSVKDSLVFGIGCVVQNWRLVLFVYFLNLSFGLILILPIVTLFIKDVSHSLVAKSLSEGFDYRWYVEFVHTNFNFFRALSPGVIFTLILYAALDMFLTGGFFVVLSKRGRARIYDVLTNGARNFPGMILVSCAQIVVIILLYELNRIWTEGVARSTVSALSEYVIWRANLLRYASILVLLLGVIIMSDFSRAGVALGSEKNFFLRAFRGLAFVFKYPLSITAIFLILLVMSASLSTAYFWASFYLHAQTLNEVIVGIIVGQTLILLRAAMKLLFYSAEGFFYINAQTEVIIVTPEMLE